MSITLRIDVEEDEIVYEASRRERQTLLRELLKEMDIADVEAVLNDNKNDEKRQLLTLFVNPGYKQTPMEFEHNKALLNLSRRYTSISKEDCDLIINLSNKY